MPKTTKKKPMSKAAAAALKATENMVITTDPDVHFEQMMERLRAAGIGSDIGSINSAGRVFNGSGGRVVVELSSGDGFGSDWPEWAFGVAEGALHFNKKVIVVYNGQPIGRNLLQVHCLDTPV